MSHDIRTPMNAILGMTAIADMHAENPARVRDCLKKITTSSKYLLSLINEILDMSRIENGKLGICENNFDLGELVENTLELCRPLLMQKNHEIRIAIGQKIHESLVGDADRLQKVFLNILIQCDQIYARRRLIEWTVNERPLELMDSRCWNSFSAITVSGCLKSLSSIFTKPFCPGRKIPGSMMFRERVLAWRLPGISCI